MKLADERLAHDAPLIGYKETPRNPRNRAIAVYADGMVKRLQGSGKNLKVFEWQPACGAEHFMSCNPTITRV